MSLKLDAIDLKILDLIQENGRITIKSMSEILNLSTTPVFERIKKLEKEGFIKQYTALLNERKLGLKQTVFISLTLKEHNRSYLTKFETDIKTFPEVMECYRITGNFDFLVNIPFAEAIAEVLPENLVKVVAVKLEFPSSCKFISWLSFLMFSSISSKISRISATSSI